MSLPTSGDPGSGDLSQILSQPVTGGGSSGSGGSTPPFDPNSLLQQYGLDPNTIGVAGAGQIGPQTQIYIGGRKITSYYNEPGMGRQANTVDNTHATIQDLLNQFYTLWAQGKAGSIISSLESHGLIKPGATVDEVAQAYQGVLEMTAKFNQAGTNITWQDVLSKWGQGGAAGRPSQYTTTSQQVNLTDPAQANALLMQSLQNRLGRDPSPAEKQAFLSSLHAYERENPSITKTTYNLNSSGQYDTSSQTTGGVDPNAFTNTYSTQHNNKEYGAYQAAGTYMNALMQAIGATV